MSDWILDVGMVIIPPALILEIFVIYLVWRRKKQRTAAKRPPAAAEPPFVAQDDEDVNSVLSELDEVSQKVLGEGVVRKQR